jgi:hypothetical protein
MAEQLDLGSDLGMRQQVSREHCSLLLVQAPVDVVLDPLIGEDVMLRHGDPLLCGIRLRAP